MCISPADYITCRPADLDHTNAWGTFPGQGICMYVYIYIYTYIHTCICVCVCICVYIYIYMYMYMYTYMYLSLYTYICIYIYICTYTHTHPDVITIAVRPWRWHRPALESFYIRCHYCHSDDSNVVDVSTITVAHLVRTPDNSMHFHT